MPHVRSRSRKQEPSRFSVDRMSVLSVLVGIVFLGVLIRLGYLQIFQYGKYTALAEAQRTRTLDLLPQRGTIFLSEEGKSDPFPVATMRQTETAFVSPRDLRDRDAAVNALTDIIVAFEKRNTDRRNKLFFSTGQQTPKEHIEQKDADAALSPEDRQKRDEDQKNAIHDDFAKRFGRTTDPYESLIPSYEQLDDEALDALHNANIPGVQFRQTTERYYPEGTLAAHVLGYVQGSGIQIDGQGGIEASFNDQLHGRLGLSETERDVLGRWISVGGVDIRPPEDGSSVVLTIDRVVQTLAENVAHAGRDRYAAERASILVMDPQTGEIKALANVPSYDPNSIGDVRSVDVLKNPVVSDLFEPGSIFKPLVMSIAMDLGLITPTTTMNDAGKIRIGGYPIDTFDGKHQGVITMTNILEQSNNVGMVWVAQKIGAEKLYAGLRRFGIGDRTGVPLPNEASRLLSSPDRWKASELATVGFGQGVVVTPIEILAANAALVNGGKLMEPHLIKEIGHPDGTKETVQPKLIRHVVNAETATRLSAMLTSVVEKGVAQLAQVKGYYVGGKTGTAQVVDPKTGHYAPDKKIISFVGFAPADNPKFIVLIKLDNPAGLSFASGTAAPMFRDLATKLLDYYRIPPSRTIPDDQLKKLKSQSQ